MKKIIKHGETYKPLPSKFYTTCPECNEKIYILTGFPKLLHCVACKCIFEYEDCDMCGVSDNEDTSR